MNGYVEVVFKKQPDAKRYLYGVPDYVELAEVVNEEWAIIKDPVHKKPDPPYLFVRIVGVYAENPRDFEPTKQIVDIVRSRQYAVSENIYERKMEEKMLMLRFSKVPLRVKRAMLKEAEKRGYFD